jgi:uncharacterized protein YjbI with pentapeptide repeats
MNTKSILSLSLFAVLLIGAISFDDAYAKPDKEDKEKQTKLQKECAKDPKSDDKIKAHCELLGLIGESEEDPRADSFFDVFFDVFTVDSFFDIFTELQTQSHDKYTDQEAIDAVGLHTVDIDTLYSGVDFATSNQNCAVGNVVTGIDENGIITCVLDETGTSTDTSALQNQVNVLQNQVDTIRCTIMLENADLNGCDLSKADLSGINLNGADFSNANLRFTNLSNADLEDANFIGADLTNTNFREANLSNADFRNQDLTNTILSYANLHGANLNGADLSNVDLTKTNLNIADLTGADLTNARLSGNLNGAKFINANLSGANLSGAGLSDIFTFVEGAYADPPCTGHSVCSTIPLSP